MAGEHNDDAVLRSLARLESKVEVVDSKLDGVRGEVGHIRERTAVVESQLVGVNISVGELSLRVRELEQDRPTKDVVTELKATVEALKIDNSDLKAWRQRQVGILMGISLVAGFIGYLLNLLVTHFNG